MKSFTRTASFLKLKFDQCPDKEALVLEQKLQDFFANKTPGLIRFETIAFLIAGILTIFFPHAMEEGFNYLFGTVCIVFGVIQLTYFASSTAETTPATNWVPFITALTGVSVGIVMYVDGMFFIKTFLGSWLFTFGLFQIYRVIQQYKTLSFWGLTLFCGLASVMFACVTWFNWPLSGIANVGYFIGPNLIITAITIWYNNRSVFTNNKKTS